MPKVILKKGRVKYLGEVLPVGQPCEISDKFFNDHKSRFLLLQIVDDEPKQQQVVIKNIVPEEPQGSATDAPRSGTEAQREGAGEAPKKRRRKRTPSKQPVLDNE